MELDMLWDASTIIGCRLLGRDGEGGTVSDLLFDDTSWHMRWIVMDKPCCSIASASSCPSACAPTTSIYPLRSAPWVLLRSV